MLDKADLEGTIPGETSGYGYWGTVPKGRNHPGSWGRRGPYVNKEEVAKTTI
jgi:hypothetical protein